MTPLARSDDPDKSKNGLLSSSQPVVFINLLEVALGSGWIVAHHPHSLTESIVTPNFLAQRSISWGCWMVIDLFQDVTLLHARRRRCSASCATACTSGLFTVSIITSGSMKATDT